MLRMFGDVFNACGVEWYNRALTEEVWNICCRELHCHGARAFDKLVSRRAPPIAFGEPYGFGADTVFRSLDDWSYNNVIAKEIFVLIFVCFLDVGIFVVERVAYRDASLVGASSHSINIGEQGVAEIDSLTHIGEIGEFPNLTFDSWVVSGVCPEYRREYAVLKPAQHKFGVIDYFFVSDGMASEIMSPVAISHV